ncbi:hypothetical protein MCUN1_001937 [Malassezia cuniculi]|uniref:BZIP domain-containing protein n=1 Tax=Malassezia cuniculi TaxID=948313 RepID=A0AAF0EQR6_9BASI|nr:hypothetical protein MCUN1_001937 [Malassezia cuniculi]
MPSPRKARARAEGDDFDASSPYNPPDDEDIRSDFFSTFDPNAFLAELEAYTQHSLPTPKPVEDTQPLDFSNNGLFSSELASTPTPASASAPAHQQHANTSNAPESHSQSEFYATAIQILTHILGSSRPYPWLAPDTPQPQTAATGSFEPDLQRLISTLIERLGGNAAPPGGVREQDLTRLLHTLMEQQQAQSTQLQKRPSVAQTGFADLNLPEDEDDDDPDFLPLPGDTPQETIPGNVAWTRAMHEVVGAPAGNTPLSLGTTSAAKAARLHKHLQSDVTVPPQKARPGRTKIYTAEEAAERKRARNRTYAKKQRQKLRRQRLGLPSDDETSSAEPEPHSQPSHPHSSPPPLPSLQQQQQPQQPQQQQQQTAVPTQPVSSAPSTADGLMLAAENRFLREEIERLRDENARLRGREEMRAYVARMRAGEAPDLYM